MIVRKNKPMVPQELAERRKKVASLCDGKRSIAEVALMTGAPRSAVARDIEALRRSGRKIKVRQQGFRRISDQKVKEIHERQKSGQSEKEIARALDIHLLTVRQYTKIPDVFRVASDVVVFADGSRLKVSHGVSAESARRMALAMSRGREVVSHTVEAA